MKTQISILVDELHSGSPYIICECQAGKHRVIKKGKISTSDELRAIQILYEKATVYIDCSYMNTDIHNAARHYGWTLVKFKNNDYPFIEAMVQLAG